MIYDIDIDTNSIKPTDFVQCYLCEPIFCVSTNF